MAPLGKQIVVQWIVASLHARVVVVRCLSVMPYSHFS